MPDDDKPDLQTVPAVPDRLVDGRDELNFAEFPLACISKRVDPTTKTLVFEDEIFDKRRNELIKRRLTITGSDAYGLPTSVDDEVLLGLVQLTKLQRFDSKRVFFSRYQLIRLLHWPVNGHSYARIDEALNRWVGVTLYYDGAWRDRDTNDWVDEKFHILERVKVNRDENERVRPKPHPDQGTFEFAASFFVWNDVVFRSFKSGNLKALDFDFVLELKSSVTRRLYRFLDKRFFHVSDKRPNGGTLEFDLKILAYEKLGLSRNTPTGDLKRQFGAAIDELVERRFLKDLPLGERFRKVKAGEWRVRFERAQAGTERDSATEAVAVGQGNQAPALSPLEARLVALGVKTEKARSIIQAHPEAFVCEKAEVVEQLVAKRDRRVSTNPAGFLIRSIEQRFESPRDLDTEARRQAKEEARRKREEAAAAREAKRRENEERKALEREAVIAKFWDSLTPEMRKSAEQAAIERADRFQRELLQRGGSAGGAARKNLMDAYALSELAEG